MLLAMDPPRHVDYRRPLPPSFKAKVIAGLEDRVRAICRDIFDRVGDGEVEFVHDVTSGLPVAGGRRAGRASPRRTGPRSTAGPR